MPASLELAIRDLLISNKDSDRVAELLFERLKTTPLGSEDRLHFVHFIIQSGHYAEALTLFAKWFEEKNYPSIHTVRYLLQKIAAPLDAQLLENLTAAEDALNAPMIKIALEKLNYFRLHRMFEEEKKQLAELHRNYPEDKAIQNLGTEFNERWAHEVLGRKANYDFELKVAQAQPKLTLEEKKAAAGIISEMLRLTEKQPNLSYNFALGAYFLELYHDANDILALGPKNLATDWFTIEVLLCCRLFAEALDAITNVELKYADNPETAFGATYHRAIALEGLGRTDTAIQLLQSIVSIRPNYRTAHSLLLKWGASPR